MTRTLHWPILVIGVIMIVMPFAISLPSKAAAGQTMLDTFHPLMQPAAVAKAATYYDKTFVPLGPVATGGAQAAAEAPQMMGALGQALHMTPAQVQRFLGTKFPAMGQLLGSLPRMKPVFDQVPGGLTYYKPLLATMKSQEGNYAAVDSLPSFNLFAWFFVIPGALLVLLAGAGLLSGRKAKN